jgi:hypothetical protein
MIIKNITSKKGLKNLSKIVLKIYKEKVRHAKNDRVFNKNLFYIYIPKI